MSLPEIKPGCAFEIPDTSINAVKPNPLPPGNWNAVFTECSWCQDPDTGIFYLPISGGHGDNANNATFAFNARDTPKWFVHHPGSPINMMNPLDEPSATRETYKDGLPASRHTRDAVEFIRRINSIFVQGGSLWSGSGGNSTQTWLHNIETKEWKRGASAPDRQFTNVYCALDEATDSILVARPLPLTPNTLRLYRYFYLTDTWQHLNDSPQVQHRKTLCYDPDHKILILCGLGQITRWNLNEPSKPGVSIGGWSTKAPALGIVGWGVEYDPDLKKFVIWAQTHEIFFLDPITMELTAHVWPAENTARLPGQPGGTTSGLTGPMGRFRRDPVTKLYFILNSVPENVFVWRAPNPIGGEKMFAVDFELPVASRDVTVAPGTTAGKYQVTIENPDGSSPRTELFDGPTGTFNDVALGNYKIRGRLLDQNGNSLQPDEATGTFEVKEETPPPPGEVTITVSVAAPAGIKVNVRVVNP